jgi:hypothetical protein
MLGRRNMAIAATIVLVAVVAGLAVLARQFFAPPGASQPFDPMTTPFVSQAKKAELQQFYPSAPNFKAVAVAFDGLGLASNAPSEEAARQHALEDCRSVALRPCFIYAVGMEVVWPRKSLPPLPLPVDINALSTKDRLDVNALPLVNLNTLRVPITLYTNSKDELKTLAIGREGTMSWTPNASTLQDSVRHTLEVCSFWANRQCLLIARGDYLTQPLPTLRKVKDIFLFSDDTQIPPADRGRLEKIYLGDNWRAIAAGERGTWEAVAGKPSEAEAISAALDLCSRSGDACRIFAIGNFLVED